MRHSSRPGDAAGEGKRSGRRLVVAVRIQDHLDTGPVEDGPAGCIEEVAGCVGAAHSHAAAAAAAVIILLASGLSLRDHHCDLVAHQAEFDSLRFLLEH